MTVGAKSGPDLRKIRVKNSWDADGVSLKYLVFVAPAKILIALLLAVMISKVKRGAAFYRWVVYLPAVLPVAVIFLIFGEMYGFQFGFINTVLRGWGFENPPNWLGDRNLALPSIGAAHIWMIVGFPTLQLLIGIYNIGTEMYEAASLDGASWWQTFWRIALPLATSAMVIIGTLAFVGVWSDYILTYTMNDRDAQLTISVGIKKVLATSYESALSPRFRNQFAGEAADATMLLFSALPVMIIYALMQKWFMRGLTEGAIKF